MLVQVRVTAMGNAGSVAAIVIDDGDCIEDCLQVGDLYTVITHVSTEQIPVEGLPRRRLTAVYIAQLAREHVMMRLMRIQLLLQPAPLIGRDLHAGHDEAGSGDVVLHPLDLLLILDLHLTGMDILLILDQIAELSCVHKLLLNLYTTLMG